MYQSAMVAAAAMSRVRTCGRASAEMLFSFIFKTPLKKKTSEPFETHCNVKKQKGKDQIGNDGQAPTVPYFFLSPFSFCLLYSPDLPPDFSSRRTSVIVMALSRALHMS